MGTVLIWNETTKDPISLIGRAAGVCWGANISNQEKNYKRGMSCIKNNHGRTLEYPEVVFVLDGYSARVIREFYTHIGGAPTRLQASTRYINYENFDYVTPPKIQENEYCKALYDDAMELISNALKAFEEHGIPKEDSGMLLPLAMETKTVVRMNLRTMVAMAHQRLCTRAYWEFRNLMRDLMNALSAYSKEWEEIVNLLFVPKCEECGYCVEDECCGRMPKKEEFI